MSRTIRWTFRAFALAALALTALPAAAQDSPGTATSDRSGAAAKDTSGGKASEDSHLDPIQEAMRRWRLQLEYHAIGATVPKGEFRFANFIRMHPSGFRADKYDLYFAPTYGLGAGWEVGAGFTGAERIGPGGNALFYGAGFQKQFVTETGSRPAVSAGVYGMFGPHDHHAGTLYLAATKEVWRRGNHAIFLHGGAQLEGFDSDDYGDGTGIRPYVGATFVLTNHVFLTADFSPAQPWEDDDMFAIRATWWVWKRVGVSGGIRNNGFDTQPFVGLTF